MNFLKKLFGFSTAANSSTPKRERDNKGTRHETSADAIGYWMGARMSMARKDPFVIYTFKSREDAHAALLELPCIHVAEDTQKLICTEPFTFGYYQMEPVWEAIICGDDLTKELWQAAKDSFAKHGGTPKTEQQPTKAEAERPKPQPKPSRSKVTYLKEETHMVDGQPCKYRVHKAASKDEAMTFLTDNPVTKNFLYIVVETPEGNYSRDINGIFKE